jgi:ABC-type nitrate/sulfonate/bicarbonate transport system substrate-binding protein
MAKVDEISRDSIAPGKPGVGSEIRIGFVPLNDCAPLLLAEAAGRFERHGLRVKLSRELGWASIRAKLAYGELDAAHAPATLPFTLTYGIDGPAAECVTGLVLNLNGNAITLSSRLAEAGVTDAVSLGDHVRRHRGEPLTFGVVSPHSSHPFLLRRWLAGGGLEPGRDVRVVVVPPPQMWANLRAGHLDGYCSGEPWNSAAILAGDGWCAATGAELAPRHPEKVLAVRGAWAQAHPDEHVRLVAAILSACRDCDDATQHERVIALLARPAALNLPANRIRPAWSARFPMTRDTTRPVPEFTVFHRFDANEPCLGKAAWVAAHLLPGRVPSPVTPTLLGRTFRPDVFSAAQAILKHPETESTLANKHEIHPSTV